MEYLKKTASALQMALNFYESFGNHIFGTMIDRISHQDDATQRRGMSAAKRASERFHRHVQLMLLKCLPTARLCSTMTYVMYHYAAQVFYLEVDENGSYTRITEKPDLQASAELLALFHELQSAGLGDDLAQRAFAQAMDRLIDKFIESPWAKVDWVGQAKITSKLRRWINYGFTPFVKECIKALSKEDDSSQRGIITDAYVKRWESMATERLGRARVDDLFDFVLRWDRSIGAIRDLKVCASLQLRPSDADSSTRNASRRPQQENMSQKLSFISLNSDYYTPVRPPHTYLICTSISSMPSASLIRRACSSAELPNRYVVISEPGRTQRRLS
jgi:anaphase-promoting complex subunit 2